MNPQERKPRENENQPWYKAGFVTMLPRRELRGIALPLGSTQSLKSVPRSHKNMPRALMGPVGGGGAGVTEV